MQMTKEKWPSSLLFYFTLVTVQTKAERSEKKTFYINVWPWWHIYILFDVMELKENILQEPQAITWNQAKQAFA